MPANAFPMALKAIPRDTASSTNVPSCWFIQSRLARPSLATKMSVQPSPSKSATVTPRPVTPSEGVPTLLTVDETAGLLRTTRAAVYAMIARAQLPGVTRLGRRVLVRADALVHWLDQNRAPSPQE